MSWLVTCTEVGRAHLASLAPTEDRVELVYHGLDFSRFEPPVRHATTRDGSNKADPLQILSVGRAVPKKGYDVLLRALKDLPGDLHWEFEHVGGGLILDTMKEQARKLGIEDRITFKGAQAQAAVLDAYRRADIFVWRAASPRMATGMGCRTFYSKRKAKRSRVSQPGSRRFPELIIDGETGLLVPQEDPAAMTQALKKLMSDPALRYRLGQAGFTRMRETFSHEVGIARLVEIRSVRKRHPSPGERVSEIRC